MFGAFAFGWSYPAQAGGQQAAAAAAVAAGRYVFRQRIRGRADLEAPAAELEARGRVRIRVAGRGQLQAAGARLEGRGMQDVTALEDDDALELILGGGK